MKKAAKRKKPETVGMYKKKAWDIYSKYIRLSYADMDGFVKCVTCFHVGDWRSFDAGHYISRKYNSLFLDDRNVHPQCKKCNIFNHGKMDNYAIYLMNKYGKNVLYQLDEEKNRTKKFTIAELKEFIEEYTEKVEKLMKRIGV